MIKSLSRTMINSNTGKPDWNSIRDQFPVTRDYIYLNHAAISPIPLYVREQITECIDWYCYHGIVCNSKFLELADNTRTLAAQLINARASEIAFIKNTTQGIQIAANGIRWQPGDNVLIPENEFPANVFPWLNLVKTGVEVRFIPINDGRFTAEDIVRFIDKRTKAVSVSAVSFTNGFRCDLDAIGRLCKDTGVFFIVDAIQALGALKIDVKKSRIDLLSADAHKWLLGPQGIGISYISDTMLDNIEVSNLGYKGMVDEQDYLDHTIRLKPDASRFEEGTLNITGIIGLKASLELLLSIGILKIEKRLFEITDLLSGKLLSRDFVIKSPPGMHERSGIISFYHKKISTGMIYENLFKANVVCATRDGAIRISPHFYNNNDDVDNFLNALPEI